MQVRELTYAQAAEIYRKHLKADFPPAEVKPLLVIRQAWSRKRYHAYGFYERSETGEGTKESLCAYAFFLADHQNRVLLLDYFAVCRSLRGSGYGSRALALLRRECAGWNEVIIEVEDDELPDLEEETRRNRQRRIAFYTGAGCLMTTTRSRLWGVDYRIMVMPIKLSGLGEQTQEDRTQGEQTQEDQTQGEQAQENRTQEEQTQENRTQEERTRTDQAQTELPRHMAEKIRCLYEGMYAGKILKKHFEITTL